MKNKTLNGMKKITITTLLLFMAIIGCKKSTTQSTALEFTVTDDIGGKVSGATIRLFSNQTDLLNLTNQIGTQTTDANGKATFSNLNPVTYYYFVENGCKDNANTGYKTSSNLLANTKNTVSVSIASTGTMKFVNTSSYQYRIYVNGVDGFTMNGGTTQSLFFAPTGNYTIRVLQLNGYAVYPTDETFTGTLNCGSTLTTTFP